MTKLNTVFEKIEQGNSSQETGNSWDAAHRFCEATILLADLTVHQSTVSVDDEEQLKIAELYDTQRASYFRQARKCFVEAVTEEQSQTQDDESARPPIVSDEEAEARVTTFSNLFSKPLELPRSAEEKPLQDQQSSLEERLASLNSSLPQGYKTSKERVAELNQGLSRLGLTPYSNSDGISPDVEDKSEDEQVADIIAQATDEVRLGIVRDATSNTDDGDHRDTDEHSNSSASTSSLDLEDIGMATPFPKRKMMKRKILKAQVYLTKLIAWLDAIGEQERDIQTDDADDDSNSETLDVVAGQTMLKKARRNLKRASLDWPDLI